MARIVPGVPALNLAPRIGSEVVRERSGVRYLPLRTRSLLNRCASARVPFDWTVNPYRGCAMGCRYCYAAYTHEYLGLTAAEEFHTTVFVKRGGEDDTLRRLQSAARRRQFVALGTATDPYQPGETELRATRRFLEAAAQVRGLRLGLTTKGALVLRDLDLLRRIHERSRLSIAVSLISPRADLLRRIEPWAPPPAVRLDVLRGLIEAGLDAGLAVAPVLPGLTDQEADLDALLAQARAAGVRRFSYNLLFLRSPTREKYLRFVAADFPRWLPAYERAYAGRVYLRGAYERRLRDRLKTLARVHGLQLAHFRDPEGRASGAPPVQLSLWP